MWTRGRRGGCISGALRGRGIEGGYNLSRVDANSSRRRSSIWIDCSLSVLESSSWGDRACSASEPATGIGGVLREPWLPSCFSGIERSLT